MKTKERTPQQDTMLFEELDKYSKNLRIAAGQLLDVLKKIENLPQEIMTLSETLEKLKTTPIEYIDDVIIELNQNGLLVTAKYNNKNPIKATPETLREFIKKSDLLANEVVELSKKANELNKK